MRPSPAFFLRCALLVPMGVSLAAAATSEDDAVVTVKDFALMPFSNLGSSELELHPKALVGGGYDSNLYLNERDDDIEGAWFLRGVAGLDLRWVPNEADRVVFDGEVERSVYRRNPDRSFTGFGTGLKARHDGPQFALIGEAHADRTQDPLVQTRQIVPRDLWQTAGQVDYKGLVETWSAGARYDGVRYREDFSIYTADEASYQTAGLFLRYGQQVSEDDEVYARVDGDRTAYRDSGAFNDSTGLRGVVGARRGLGGRTDALIEAGLAWKRYADVFHAPDASAPGGIRYGDSRYAWGPSGKAELRYSWEELSAVTLKGFSEITDSLTANAAWYGGLGVEAQQRLLVNCAGLAGMQAYRFHDLDVIDGMEKESRTTIGWNLGVEFFLRDGVGLRLMGTYEDSHARQSESYDRYTVVTDLAVVF